MSWQASGWAKSTRGHRSHSQKLVLMVLADYYDDEKGYAWPSQARLADDCEMPQRTVQWCLRQLQDGGYVTRLQKGNQYQLSKWGLNFAASYSQAPATPGMSSEPASVAPASEPARSDMVNPQDGASEPASPVGTSLQEPEEEEPPEDIETPEWLLTLREIEGWATKGRPHEETLMAWASNKSYTDDQLEGAAIALTAAQAKTLKGYRRLDSAFKVWTRKGYGEPGQVRFSDNGPKPGMTRAERLRADQRRYEGGE